MIKLKFEVGGNAREVLIRKRKISFLTAELKFVPLLIDLDKIDKRVERQMGKEGVSLLKEIAKLNTEEEIARDIIEDFKKTGWRLVHKQCH